MTNLDMTSVETVDAAAIAAAVYDLGTLALKLGETERKTFHADGKTPETVTTHTVMVIWQACSIAERINSTLPLDSPDRLDLGLIAQMAAVHDAVEAIVDDTDTLRLLSKDALAAKKAREQVGARRIAGRLLAALPWMPVVIGMYEEFAYIQSVIAAANFVWGVDKMSAKITHVANRCAAPRAKHVTVAELTERYAVQRVEMLDRCGRWPLLIALYDKFVGDELTVLAHPVSGGAPAPVVWGGPDGG